MPHYGVLSYSGTNNLGDEIQSLAATGLLPRVDHYLNRDNLRAEGDRLDQEVFTVMNGWYCQWPERWPPSLKIRPLLTSVHFTAAAPDSSFGLIPSEYMLVPPISNYLHEHGPIGARDHHTLALLQKAGIPSYFSGCMTLTLDRPEVPRNDDLIVYNDIPDKAVQFLRQTSRKHLFRVSHINHEEQDRTARIARARELLHLYARASCVVTSRLHCALPSLAMGTPVLMLDTAGDTYRFQGLHDLLYHCTPDAFISGKFAYDVDNPPPNQKDYIIYRLALIKRVRDFIAEAERGTPTEARFQATDQDRQEAMLNLFRQKNLPQPGWRARHATFIKTKPQLPDTAATGGSIKVNSGSLLSAEFFSEHEGRLFGRNLYVNGKPLAQDSWSISQNDWETLTA